MLRVITPPEPIVTPADIPGSHAADDPAIEAMIGAVTGAIDGPLGWLGRAFGPQVLELSLECWPLCPLRMPCPPVITIDSVAYVDGDDVAQDVDAALWGLSSGLLWFKDGFSRPALGQQPYPITITYQAGYDGEAEGTGELPAPVKQAVILLVQHMMSISRDDLFLKVDEVDGIGRREWTVSEQAGNIIRSTSERLLQGLRVYG